MKSRVKGLIALVCMSNILISGVAFADSGFDDVKGHWSVESVNHLTDKGMVHGYPDGEFKPNRHTEVSSFIKIVVEYSGEEVTTKSGDKWYDGYYRTAKAMGIVSDADFNYGRDLERTITRDEMTKVLVRYQEDYLKLAIKASNTASDFYKDIDGNENSEYIEKATEMGLVMGLPDGNFKPKGEATRAEAVTIIHRLIDESRRVTEEEREKIRQEHMENEDSSKDDSDLAESSSKYALALKEAERLNALRVPYVYGGNSEAGMDCSAFVAAAYRSAGINLSRSTRTQINEGKSVSFESIKEGDLIFFDTRSTFTGSVSHVGMYIGNNTMIHAANPRKGIMHSELSSYWKSRILAVKRHF